MSTLLIGSLLLGGGGVSGTLTANLHRPLGSGPDWCKLPDDLISCLVISVGVRLVQTSKAPNQRCCVPLKVLWAPPQVQPLPPPCGYSRPEKEILRCHSDRFACSTRSCSTFSLEDTPWVCVCVCEWFENNNKNIHGYA